MHRVHVPSGRFELSAEQTAALHQLLRFAKQEQTLGGFAGTGKSTLVAERLRRVRTCPALPLLLAAGVRVEIWGWAKRNGRWQACRVAIRPGDLEAITIADLPRSRRGCGGVRNQPLTREDLADE
jgi:hypothetical protein